jgi:hypothetical protein
MGYLIDILIAVATRILTGELSAHVEPMAWIIGRAVERLPTDDRDRFREEWLAHLNETPGTLRKLWHAVGCRLGAGKVAGVLARQPPLKRGVEIMIVGPVGPFMIEEYTNHYRHPTGLVPNRRAEHVRVRY